MASGAAAATTWSLASCDSVDEVSREVGAVGGCVAANRNSLQRVSACWDCGSWGHARRGGLPSLLLARCGNVPVVTRAPRYALCPDQRT